MEKIWADVDRYLGDLLAPHDAALDRALGANQNAGLPAIDVPPLLGRFLEILIRINGARRVLEIGTLGGYSTIWMARALPPDGRLITLELEQHHADIARANFEAAGVLDRVEIQVGPALDSMKALYANGPEPFDLIFIDADKQSLPDYLDWSLRLSHPGTIIVADNVVRDGKVTDPNSTDPHVRGVQRFLQKASSEPRLTSTAIPTVGGRGFDGFSVSVVRE